jgi:hypothetical protein
MHASQAQTTTKEIVFLTANEKATLKNYLESDNAERSAELHQADTIIKTLIKKENSNLKNEQMQSMQIKINNLTNRIQTNLALINKLLMDTYVYNDVVEQLKILGKKPQDILNASGARGSFFNGEKVEPLFLQINAISSKNFNEDIELSFKKYTESKNNLTQIEKCTYIYNISNQLQDWCKAKHTASSGVIMDPLTNTLLKEAVDIFEEWVNIFKKDPTITKDSTANQKLKDIYLITRQLRQDERI